MPEINNTPPVLGYLLAAALRLGGGGELATRVFFLPFELAAALSLFALASRFLRRPLWPVLAVTLGPAWTLNMGHVMAERVMAGFAFPALWLLVKSADERRPALYWASAALAALAVLSKYNAVFLLLPALGYSLFRGVPPRRIAAWLALALSGAGAYWLASRAASGAAAHVLSQSAGALWSDPWHKLRSLLAFTGGLGLLGAAWGLWLRPGRDALLALGLLAAGLFSPLIDLAPLVRTIDRLTGFALAFCALAGLAALRRAPCDAARALFLPWLASALLLQAVYWSVLARFIVFALPALLFWLWARLEDERPALLSRLGPASAALALLMSALLGAVDWRYAAAQREAAAEARARADARGGTLWCAGHWGLQEYMTAAGARMLDAEAGGWDAVRPGDVVVVPEVNSNVLRPARPIRAAVSAREIGSAIPLRLISGFTGEGGFYTNVTGFLPWSLSAEPVDRISRIEPL